jgi:16S rRNA G1207 methylase RsmC
MPHYYSQKQDSLNIKKILIRNKEFYTGAGVFSKKRLDKGTELLIDKCIIKPNWTVLDLGCGIGVVGIFIKMRTPSVKVLMTDINENAVKLSKMNVKNLDIKVKKSNLFEKINEKFNTILVNPPQTAGKDVCFKIIEESKTHLEKEGLLQLVARHKKGGITLKKKMQEVYGNAEEIAKGSGYRIYVSKLQSINSK